MILQSMINTLALVFSGSGSFILNISIKGFFLLIPAILIIMALRKKSAAVRHMIWTLSITALLLIPPVSYITPDLNLNIFPGQKPLPETLYMNNNAPEPLESVPVTNDTELIMSTEISHEIPMSNSTPENASASPYEKKDLYLFLFFSIWLSGTLYFLLQLFAGFAAIQFKIRKLKKVSNPEWIDEIINLRQQLNIKRKVKIYIGEKNDMPMTWGIFLPSILLPSISLEWKKEKLRSVLIHELTHIKRFDCLTHTISKAAFALHWLNPLVWFAIRSMRIERERACDDSVLKIEKHPSKYAEFLLEIARTMQSSSLTSAAAITMAKKSQLEGRLLFVLDKKTNRRSITRFALGFASLICMLLLFTISSVQIAGGKQLSIREELLENAKPVKKTTLESMWGGWRNLPFEISVEEENDLKKCIEMVKYPYGNKKKNFIKEETREDLEQMIESRPDLFYAEFLLGCWHRINGNTIKAEEYINLSLERAPVVLIQQYNFKDGTPLQNTGITQYALECNRVKKGYLDPSLELYYPFLKTDKNGAIYLPVYDTVYRRNSMSSPKNYNAKYPRAGWLKSRKKAGLLPGATVTEKREEHKYKNINEAANKIHTESVRQENNIREWVWKIQTDKAVVSISKGKSQESSIRVDKKGNAYLRIMISLDEGNFIIETDLCSKRDLSGTKSSGKSSWTSDIKDIDDMHLFSESASVIKNNKIKLITIKDKNSETGESSFYINLLDEFPESSDEKIKVECDMEKRPELLKKIDEMIKRVSRGEIVKANSMVREISKYQDPIAIPSIIGVLDCDNSFNTIYMMTCVALCSEEGLGKYTKQKYQIHMDGGFWKTWWKENKIKFPEEVQNVPIPVIPKTEYGKIHEYYPENMNTLEGKISWLEKNLNKGHKVEFTNLAQEISNFNDSKCIPYLIGIIDADNSKKSIYAFGYYGLRKITGVKYSPYHDGACLVEKMVKKK